MKCTPCQVQAAWKPSSDRVDTSPALSISRLRSRRPLRTGPSRPPSWLPARAKSGYLAGVVPCQGNMRSKSFHSAALPTSVRSPATIMPIGRGTGPLPFIASATGPSAGQGVPGTCARTSSVFATCALNWSEPKAGTVLR